MLTFKKINDFFGHGVGDEVLISLAHVINSCCRSEDIVCRFGGEEFVIFSAEYFSGNSRAYWSVSEVLLKVLFY